MLCSILKRMYSRGWVWGSSKRAGSVSLGRNDNTVACRGCCADTEIIDAQCKHTLVRWRIKKLLHIVTHSVASKHSEPQNLAINLFLVNICKIEDEKTPRLRPQVNLGGSADIECICNEDMADLAQSLLQVLLISTQYRVTWLTSTPNARSFLHQNRDSTYRSNDDRSMDPSSDDRHEVTRSKDSCLILRICT
jgi:hypothetical protein